VEETLNRKRRGQERKISNKKKERKTRRNDQSRKGWKKINGK